MFLGQQTPFLPWLYKLLCGLICNLETCAAWCSAFCPVNWPCFVLEYSFPDIWFGPACSTTANVSGKMLTTAGIVEYSARFVKYLVLGLYHLFASSFRKFPPGQRYQLKHKCRHVADLISSYLTLGAVSWLCIQLAAGNWEIKHRMNQISAPLPWVGTWRIFVKRDAAGGDYFTGVMPVFYRHFYFLPFLQGKYNHNRTSSVLAPLLL